MIPKQPKSFDIALLDADEIAYAAGFSSEPTWYKIVIDRDYYDEVDNDNWREAPLHLEDGEEEPDQYEESVSGQEVAQIDFTGVDDASKIKG